MDETSALFSEQAAADLRTAKAVPLHDLSGQALGISMFHAQQCIEKQLKAIVLRLNEALDFDKENRFLREMSHDFYPKVHKFYGRFVKILGTPPSPVIRLMDLDPADETLAGNDRAIGYVASFWKEYAAPGSRVQMCVWKRFLHVKLSRDELGALNRFVRKSAAFLPGELGLDGSWNRGRDPFTNDFGHVPPMRSVIGDEGRTDAVYSDYVGRPQRQGMQELHDYRAGHQDRIFSDAGLSCLGGLTREARRKAAGRLVAEFAFEAAGIMIYRYMTLYPHARLGRYPVRLPGGTTSAAVYESRADVVLHRIYNETRFSMDLLRGHYTKLDELCRLGSEHGYWKDGA